MIERGPAKYFHGREKELKLFNRLLSTTIDRQMGSSFLIQGPPGVGKSALLEEHIQQAQKKQWEVIELSNECLFNPKELFAKLTKKTKPKEFKKSFGLDLKVFKMNLEKIPVSETNTLNEALILSKPTLLWLDETQTLKNFSNQMYEPYITSFLTRYHNLKTNQGFVLLLGGLSHTEQILEHFGISRWNNQCVHSLKRLTKKNEESILNDWLQQEIQTPSNPQEWIDQITQETDQWPSHIQSYCNALEIYLKPQEPLSPKRLEQVLAFGHDLKKRYYQQRCRGFDPTIKTTITLSIQALPDVFYPQNFIDQLAKKVPFEEAKDIYQKTLAKGIVDLNEDDLCSVPIPSFRSFLIETYGQKLSS